MLCNYVVEYNSSFVVHHTTTAYAVWQLSGRISRGGRPRSPAFTKPPDTNESEPLVGTHTLQMARQIMWGMEIIFVRVPDAAHKRV